MFVVDRSCFVSKPITKATCLKSTYGVKMTDGAKTGADYVSISCATHSGYELAILHRQKLRLVWYEGNVIHDRIILPLDLQTRNHEEFLIGRDETGTSVTIRLDHIRRKQPA